MWEFYLAASESAFRWQGLLNFQIQLAHKVSTVPLTRDYIMDEEKRLKALDAPSPDTGKKGSPEPQAPARQTVRAGGS